MTQLSAPVPIITSVSPLASRYDAVLCDVWGVVHNGVRAFDIACEALRCFRAAGTAVLLLTNAPRPAHSVADQLRAFGVPDDCYDDIVSSGDLTRSLIRDHAHQPMVHLGTDRDKAVFKNIDVKLVDGNAAEVIVCTNLFDDERETPEDYRDRLAAWAARGALMICANPDLKVERGPRVLWCAGALAALYEQVGGKTIYAGKPHRPVYDMAFERIDEIKGRVVDRARVLAIGDGLRTDIEGARLAGLDSLFIASAVHVDRPLDDAVLDEIFGASQRPPIAAMAALAW